MSRTTRDHTTRLSVEGAKRYQADMLASGKAGQDALTRVTKASEPASLAVREVSKSSAMLRGQLAGVGRELPAVSRIATLLGTTALASGFAAFGRSSLNIAREFQAAMKRVEAATQAGEAAMGRLEAKAKHVGAVTAFTAMDAANAIEVLAKNGLDVEEILGGALDATVMLSGALGSQLAPSADLVTDMMEQFGLQAADLPTIADRITGAALTSKFGFDDLRLAIGQAGGVAGKFGVDIEEFLTALSLTASGFASGSDAGTSFKNFLQRLTPQSKDAREAMKAIGFDAFDAAGNMKSMAEIAEELRHGVAGLSEEARNSTLQKIFGTDAIRTALSLAESGAQGFDSQRAALVDVSAAEQSKIRLEGLEGALRELASAWEALQLEAAQNGGLDLAEDLVNRLTAALRYVRENFTEVEEVVERVAQALVVYLVGRGIHVAIAKAVAMRATYIQLAASVTGVGTAATGVVGSLARLGVAARVLTGLAGGPIGLALTAASLVSLGIDTDKAADAIEDAKAASEAAADALDKYREASKLAAREQEGLAGKVSEATQKMLEQSRAQLQQALSDAQRAYNEAWEAMNSGMFSSEFSSAQSFLERRISERGDLAQMLDPEDKINEFTQGIAEAIELLSSRRLSPIQFVEQMDALRAIGDEFEDIADYVEDFASSGDVLAGEGAQYAAKLLEMARNAGIFQEQLEQLAAAETDQQRMEAWRNLSLAVMEAVRASELLRDAGLEGFRELVVGLAEAEKKTEDLRDALDEVKDGVEDFPDENPFSTIEDGARDAALQVGKLSLAYGEYVRTRSHSDRVSWSSGLSAAAEKGVLDLIGYAEGTDRGRGYNETLDYGRWTGGDVNLINMTLREVLELQRMMLANPENRALYGDGKGSSAVGRYQIVSTTLKGLIDRLGLSLDELFTPELQDRMALELVRGRQAGGPAAMRLEWEGLNRVSDARINQAMGGQVIPRVDPEVARETAAADEQRRRALEEQDKLIRRLVESGDMHAAQLELEASLIGKTEAEAARARFVFEALAEAKAKGIDVDKVLTESGETLRQAIERQADEVARATAEYERLNEERGNNSRGVDDARAAVERSLDGLRTGASSIGDAFGDMADYVAAQLWKLAFDPVFDYLASLINGIIDMAISSFAGGGSVGKSPGFAMGGEIPGFAGGGDMRTFGGRARGRIRGAGTGRQDNILLWGSRGEFMQPAAAVEYYGLDFMEAIQQLRFPRYADGGSLGAGLPAPSATGGALRGARALSDTLLLQVIVQGANGDKELKKMATEGAREALEHFNSKILPQRVQEIADDPKRIGG